MIEFSFAHAIAIREALAALRPTLKRRRTARTERRLERALSRAFLRQRRAYLKAFTGLRSLFEAPHDEEWEALFSEAELRTVKDFEGPLTEAMKKALLAGAQDAIADIGIAIDFDLKNPRAVAFIEEHGTELIADLGKTSRNELRNVLRKAIDDGWSYGRTSRRIREKFTDWSRERAHTVAITETSYAYEAGNRQAAEEIAAKGVELEHSWSDAGDERVCDTCLANAADGWIPLGQSFSSGHHTPPAHPRDRCAIIQRVKRPGQGRRS